jgi:hypothetical protein
MEDKNKKILVILLVVVAFLAIVAFLLNNKKEATPTDPTPPTIVEPIGESEWEKFVSEKFGEGYLVKLIEKYDNMEKITLDLKNVELLPTTGLEAVIFVKNGKVVRIPEGYVREIILKDIDNRKNNKEENVAYNGGELESLNFLEEFEGFNDGNKYENIYVASIKLPEPFNVGNSQMIPGSLDYEIIMVDQFGNIAFRTYNSNSI